MEIKIIVLSLFFYTCISLLILCNIFSIISLQIISFSHTLVGVNVGACVRDKPDLYTTFLFDSVWTWVQTIVSDAEGQPGPIGSGIGRVEFSSCEHFGSNVPIAPINSGLAVSFR